MKNMIVVLITVTLGLASLGVGAQDNFGSNAAAATGHPDEIVRMHQQVAAANREYNREVAAAKKYMTTRKRKPGRSAMLRSPSLTTARASKTHLERTADDAPDVFL
ncbi:hypothetical protein [Paraburkholderia terrae]